MRKYINLRTGPGAVNGMFGEMELATGTHEFGYRCKFYLISLTPVKYSKFSGVVVNIEFSLKQCYLKEWDHLKPKKLH